MEYKLTYFAARGRGEFIRLIFAAASVEYEDERLTKEEWLAFKPTSPMKILPALTVRGKGVVCQTGAIARYLAKEYGLFGSSAWEGLIIDETLECVQDMLTAAVKWIFETDEAKKEELKKQFAKNTISRFIDYLQLRLKDGKNGFLVGDKLSVADIAVFNFIDAMKKKGNDWFDAYDDVMKHYALVQSNDNIAKWLQKRPNE